MDLARSFAYPFKDSNSMTKLMTGGVLNFFSFLIFPAIAVGGYLLDVTRRAARGADDGLPGWDQWGDKLTYGFLAWVIAFIYGIIPAVLFLTGFGGFIVALVTGALASGVTESAGAFWASLAAGGAFGLALGGAGAILGLVVSFIAPAIVTRYAVTRSFGSAFNPAIILSDITRGLGHYLVIWVTILATGFVVSSVTAATSGIGLLLCLPFLFYVGVVLAHLKGQYWRTHLSNL